MPKTLKLVSPAIQLKQKVRDLDEQQAVAAQMGPEAVAGGVEDAANAAKYGGSRPTIYNVNTGQWDEVMPSQARLLGVPIGPPNPAVLNKMWRGMVRPELMRDELT